MPDPQDLAWFDALYVSAGRDPGSVPWANLDSCPWLDGFLAAHPGPGRAAVVGCGLGDDAEAVAAAGYRTTAFDVSSEAVAWCRDRFPESPVDYRTSNLLALPQEWHQAFDAVVEVRTVQSIPMAVRAEAIGGVASLVAPAGTLLVVALARRDGTVPAGPPWALSPAEMARYLEAGLVVTNDRSQGGHFVWEMSRAVHE